MAELITILFTISNILFLVLGICMVGVGIGIRLEYGFVIDVLPRAQNIDVSTVMLAAGVIVIVVACIGFYAAWTKHLCVLGFYLFCVLVVIAMEIGVAVVAFLRHDQMESVYRSQLQQSLRDMSKWDSWDELQTRFQCCGIDGPGDWYNSSTQAQMTIPDSCCVVYRQGCGQDINQARTEGCYLKARSKVTENLYGLAAAGVVFACIPVVVCAVTTAFLVCLIRNSKKRKVEKSFG